LGGLLSVTSVGLAPRQKIQVELDTKKSILGAVVELKETDDVLDIYANKIESLVVNINGDVVETDESGDSLIAENISVAKNFKLAPEDRLYPVFLYKGSNNEVEAYILPIYGSGLWDAIWGYIALDKNLNTIKGVVFDHKGETPGLGARISEGEIQSRFVGRKVYDAGGNLVSVTMLKGEGNALKMMDDHHVDGLAGATITARGVNNMLLNYLEYYQNYLKKISS